ncbi:hypothetical protein SRHO_G00120080 [Serrasalmus rhombeus]
MQRGEERRCNSPAHTHTQARTQKRARTHGSPSPRRSQTGLPPRAGRTCCVSPERALVGGSAWIAAAKKKKKKKGFVSILTLDVRVFCRAVTFDP